MDDQEYLSDESSFFGDEEVKSGLEHQVDGFDLDEYWKTHSRRINVIAARGIKRAATPATEMSIRQPSGLHTSRELYNPWDEQEYARQLGETPEEFLQRLPPVTSSQVGPWLWVANPYAERSRLPEDHDANFQQRAHRLMQEFLGKKKNMVEGNPDMQAAAVTRALKTDREKLKEDILELAKKNGMTSGKWMLFPAEHNAEKTWRQVVQAVVEDKLGTAAKIATDGDTRLICIYTRDFSDIADVTRVVNALADLKLVYRDAPRGIYYKCDAFTYLDISSGNEYGIAASLYSSKDIFSSAAKLEQAVKQSPKQQKKLTDGGFFKKRDPLVVKKKR